MQQVELTIEVDSEIAELLSDIKSVMDVYIIGGTIRSLFTGEKPKDLDLVVKDLDLLAEYLSQKYEITQEAKSFRVIKVILPSGNVVDVAGFRNETYDLISRKPVVSPAESIEEDVKRRDFTINSLYGEIVEINGNQVKLRVVDLVGGLYDLQNGIIRATGNPTIRFMEDPLRMLRALRFAVRMGFEISPETFEAITRLTDELRRVSKERIREELDKMLLSNPAEALRLIYISSVYRQIMPFLDGMAGTYHDYRGHHHGESVLQHTIEDLVRLQQLHPINIYNVLAVILHDIGKPLTRKVENGKVMFVGHDKLSAEMAEEWLITMRYPNEIVYTVSGAISLHMKIHELQATLSRKGIARMIVESRENAKVLELGIQISESDTGRYYNELRSIVVEMLSIPRLVSGEDVIYLPPDKRTPALRKIREIQLSQGIRDREQLLRLLKGLTLS
jgi:putative nucleotidyltransferase with HDIG domain